ncbi:hypothetical protein [Methylobacterium pseudosasicola]|uniref:Methyl-accepting chemotaxis protein n=1 Tax=Methylobacterium pseudosasicola TaxID=582667 RepID=A0A1I4H3R6_9HYPH|nr:hypothetical protein [Methylobacterium pseudosasicola]SFL36904.1 methyl-accepting chemotaxis protein [Methylobacterium pseudosasicola]
MAQTPDSATAALAHDWARLSEVGVAVRRSLDDALEELVRAAIENPTESYAASCARIDRAFDDRMAPYRSLSWAMDQAATLQHALKEGLRHLSYRSGKGSMRAGAADMGFPVVATEVKALADQTAAATDQIRGQVVTTHGATREAVDAIGSVQGTIRGLDDVLAPIAAAVDEQSAVTRAMSDSLHPAHGVTTIAGGIEAIAPASEQVDAATLQVP